jgi:hypothetical protein
MHFYLTEVRVGQRNVNKFFTLLYSVAVTLLDRLMEPLVLKLST